jgi:DNA invertase Pin-like site-specific DNA recombinase
MSRQRKPKAAPSAVRCAIYTRKSSEDGLEQEFNSLDAQREAAEAYIASQKGEGWVALPDRYDDGGFSGGNMDRPALARLLADVDAGGIDCVVVYKVDRLSRSLLDFARVMETFERQSVSFVSVTQQFNTTHSMGRLTLNILLSFAQFEREIIGERIRDKKAAMARKGMWHGGIPVLGYDADRSNGSPKLVVNAVEAARVREIFRLYLELKSLGLVAAELEKRGWRGKTWKTKAGKPRGGKPFDKCSLYSLLTNPLLAGKIRHNGDVYEGGHEAIIPYDTFQRVRRILRRAIGDRLLFCVLSRSPARAKRRLQPKLSRDPPNPCLPAQRRAARDAAPHGRQLLLALRLIHQLHPSTRPGRRLGQDHGQLGRARSRSQHVQARPSPVLRTPHQVRPQRIPFHVSHGRPHRIGRLDHARRTLGRPRPPPLDREALEPPLPDVAARAVAAMIPPHVRRHQPLHPAREVAVRTRPDDQVEVIRHQTPRDNPHRHALARRDHQLHKRRVVVRVVEHLRPRVAAVEHVDA